jgi:hypothetical protein
MKNAVAWGTVASLFFLFVSTGCRRDPSGPRWDVDVVGPLVTTSFTLSDLVADSLLEVDGDGNITLVYRTELFAVRLDTVLQAPDTSFSYPSVMPITGNLPAGFTFPTTSDVTRFDLDDLELRDLRIRSGILNVVIHNEIPGVVIGTFGLPGGLDANGIPFSLQATIPDGSNLVPGIFSQTTDLSGYTFDLRGPGYNDVNTLATELSYQVDPNGPANIPVVQGDSLNTVLSYEDIVPAFARGYFGDRTIVLGPERTALGVFNKVIAGTLDLDEVMALLVIRNGIGVDVQVQLDHLRATNSRTNSSIDLLHPITSGPINLNRATDLGNAPQPSTYTSVLDQGNSNLDAMLESLPDSIEYAGQLIVNPLGNVSNGNDFLYYESLLQAELEVHVPLRLIATDLVLQQTTTPDLPGSAEGHALKSGLLHLFATNGFPFSAAIVLEIINDADQVMGQIPVQGLVASGILGSNGLVTAAVDSQLDAPVSEELMDLLYSTGRLRISTLFNTADQSQHVQLLDSYRMDLQVSVEANYLVNGDE